MTADAGSPGRGEELIEVRDWAHLNEVLFEGSWQAGLQRYRSTFAFRGVSDAGFRLKTGLARLGGDYAALERHLIRNFQKYAYLERGRQASIWEWLTLAQHHGLPTRLLDWTYSPYIALHFVTVDVRQSHRPGLIWCVDFVKTNRLLADRLAQALEAEQADTFTVEMLQSAARTLAEFDALAPEPFITFFEPPSLDARIVNQFGLFSVMSSATTDPDRWLEDRPELYRKILVPAELKWEIRDKLDQGNINERLLFPGLDGLCSWLKRHYGPRSGHARGDGDVEDDG